jgi:hypothetical protein
MTSALFPAIAFVGLVILVYAAKAHRGPIVLATIATVLITGGWQHALSSVLGIIQGL